MMLVRLDTTSGRLAASEMKPAAMTNARTAGGGSRSAVVRASTVGVRISTAPSFVNSAAVTAPNSTTSTNSLVPLPRANRPTPSALKRKKPASSSTSVISSTPIRVRVAFQTYPITSVTSCRFTIPRARARAAPPAALQPMPSPRGWMITRLRVRTNTATAATISRSQVYTCCGRLASGTLRAEFLQPADICLDRIEAPFDRVITGQVYACLSQGLDGIKQVAAAQETKHSFARALGLAAQVFSQGSCCTDAAGVLERVEGNVQVLELRPGDGRALIHVQLGSVRFTEQSCRNVVQRVGGKSFPPLDCFVYFEFEAGECRHDEEVAVQVVERFLDDGDLELGVVVLLKQMREQQRLVEVGSGLSDHHAVTRVDGRLVRHGQLGVHGMSKLVRQCAQPAGSVVVAHHDEGLGAGGVGSESALPLAPVRVDVDPAFGAESLLEPGRVLLAERFECFDDPVDWGCVGDVQRAAAEWCEHVPRLELRDSEELPPHCPVAVPDADAPFEHPDYCLERCAGHFAGRECFFYCRRVVPDPG